MAIGLILLESSNAHATIRWSATFAKARQCGLVIFQFRRKKQGAERVELTRPGDCSPDLQEVVAELLKDGFRWTQSQELEAPMADSPDGDQESWGLRIVEFYSDEIVAALENKVVDLDIEMAILPRDPTVRSSSPEFALQRELLSHLPCEMIQLVSGNSNGKQCDSILVPTSEHAHSHSALRIAMSIADVTNASITPVFVEPEFDLVAKQVGERILQRILKKTLGDRHQETKSIVVLSDSVEEGIRSCINDQTDLIILGKQHHGIVHRLLFRSISEVLIQANPGPAIAVFQPALPLASRIVRAFDRLARNHIPQMERDRRIHLVERIQSSSIWDFDFIALMCLSTLIAGGGLIQNSPAVVIGAMLVAPLMTPLLGTGLSLVQGNVVMLRNTLLTVLRGFLVAFGLGCFLGFVVPNCFATTEMIARGSPRILDLVVAFLSGIAAAYAIGRPNLLSALPGVAIAASLIPPVATLGICVAIGSFHIAGGAGILFLTNIIAIITGTACVFWAVGIRGSHSHGQFNRLAVVASACFLISLIGIAVYDAWPVPRIPTDLVTSVNKILQDGESPHANAECESIRWSRWPSGQSGINVALLSSEPISPAMLDRIQRLVQQNLGGKLPVRIETKLEMTFSGSSSLK